MRAPSSTAASTTSTRTRFPSAAAGRRVESLESYFDYPSAEEGGDELVLLAGRSREDWGRLARHAERVRFRGGEDVVRAGDDDRALYLVLSGRLEALVGGSPSIDPGSVFGELAFLDGLPRSATVRAVEDGEALRLSFDAFEVLAARHPELGRAILLDLGRIAALRLRRLTEPTA
jgi:CRP-like cAMP-binding protein